jgi:hypothetical protein
VTLIIARGGKQSLGIREAPRCDFLRGVRTGPRFSDLHFCSSGARRPLQDPRQQIPATVEWAWSITSVTASVGDKCWVGSSGRPAVRLFASIAAPRLRGSRASGGSMPLTRDAQPARVEGLQSARGDIPNVRVVEGWAFVDGDRLRPVADRGEAGPNAEVAQ